MNYNRPEDLFFDAFANTRGAEPFRFDDIAVGAIMLYCRRMGLWCVFDISNPYEAHLSIQGGSIEDDPILSNLKEFIASNRVSKTMIHLWQNLSSLGNEEFIPNYPQYVDSYFRVIANFMGRRGSVDYIQPGSVTRLIAYFLRKANVNSIYNPFAGLCSYPIHMGKDCSFFAQEINPTTLALAKIRLHANGLNPDNVVLQDSILNWDNKRYDAIVASVPFGLLISPETRRRYGISANVVEDLFFMRSLGMSDGSEEWTTPNKIVATIVPQSFGYKSSSFSIRKTMCDKGCLDTVIELPEGIFPNTSVATSIIILSFTERKKEVRFVNASEFLRAGNTKVRRLDWERAISVIEQNDPQYVKTVSYRDLFSQDVILNSDNYLPATFKCEEGHSVQRLGDLMERVPESRIEYPETIYCIPEEAFTNKVLDIVHPKKDVIKVTEVTSGYRVTGPCILFIVKDRQILTYLHSDRTTVAVDRRVFAFKVVSEAVTPEYIASLLVMDPIFRRQMTQSSLYRNSGAVRYLLNRRIVIADLSGQETFLKWYETKESAEINSLRAAEDARYQINKAGGDIAHMLGSVFKKQNELIGELQFISPNSEKYPGYVTSLIDTAQYINRVITAVGKDLAKAKINLKKVNISDAVEDYVRAWGNFSGLEDFSLITQDQTEHDVILKLDILFFKIMMDTLIDNAWRHGFDKGHYTAEGGNKIAIRLSPIVLNGQHFLLLSVMNNGYPLGENYTVRDYIERGNYRGNSGRTGLGGNHVYTVIHRHEGYLSLNSERDWNFVVDLLFPIESSKSTIFNTEYDGEYI